MHSGATLRRTLSFACVFNTPREFYAHRTLQNGEVMFDDYVASAYLCLSGHEEIVRPHLDEHQRHNGRSSFLFRGGVLERPLVEDYAAQFVEAFARLGLVIPPRPAWPNGSRMALCLTCDVDQPTRNTWKSVAKAALHRFPLFEDSGAQPSPMSYIPKKDMLDPYLELERFSRRGGIPDSAWTFFFLSGKRSKLDPYDLKEHLDLPYLARSLDEKGNEIALHAPYDCWRDPLSYVQAMDDFESATGGIRPVGVRQHYLRFRVPLTWNAQAGAKLQYDASAGFACCEGFRFGTALPFRAFDEDSKKTLDLWVIPLTVMDVTLRAYRKYTPQVAGERMRKLAKETERVGGVVTFLWHNSAIGPGWENWEETFDTFLQSLAEKQVWAPTCSKLIKIWRQISEPQI